MLLVSSIQQSDSVIHVSGLPWWFGSKESACNAGDPGSIPISGRSPGEGNGYPLQCSLVENSMGREDWSAVAHVVSKSQTQLSNYHFHHIYRCTYTYLHYIYIYIYIYMYIFRFFSIIVCCKVLRIVLLLFTYFMGPCCLPISCIVVYICESQTPNLSALYVFLSPR